MRNALFFVLMLILAFPIACATEDLTGEDYITPAYGLFLNSDYYYESDGAYWRMVSTNYEQAGYYNIRDSTNTELSINCYLNSNFEGSVYGCISRDSDGTGDGLCEYLDGYTTTGSYDYFSGTLDLSLLDKGKYYFFCKNVLDVGGEQWSHKYSVYYNIEEAWERKKPISISSDYNISDGIITLTFNSTHLADFQENTLFYDSSNLYTLSGTFSQLLFTNTEKTKAYPYYIDEYLGGYYDFENNTADDMTIKIYVGEDVTAKGILMYYNYFDEGAPLEGYYELNDNYDSNNNPFLIHQVFDDVRWNLTKAATLFTLGSIEPNGEYLRGEYYKYWEYSKHIFKYKLNLTSAGFDFGRSNTGVSFNLILSEEYPNLKVSFATANTFRIYNSSNDIYAPSLGTNIRTGRRYLTFEDGYLYIDGAEAIIEESAEYFDKYNITGSSQWLIIYEVFSMNNISSTNTYYSVQNTSAGAVASLSSSSIGNTFLNEISIHSFLSTNQAGALTCYGDTSGNGTGNWSSLGSLTVPASATTKVYSLWHNFKVQESEIYNEGDEDEFFNVSQWESFDWYCVFNYGGSQINDSGSVTIDEDLRAYTQYKLPWLYYTESSPVTMSFYQVPSASTSWSGFMSIQTYGLNCFERDTNNRCIRYDTGAIVSTLTDSSTINILDISISEPVSLNYGCYLNKYTFDIDHLLGNNSTGYFYRPFCVGEAEDEEGGEPSSNQSPETEIDDYDYENAEFWDNPVLYLSSFIYQAFVVPNVSADTANIFLGMFRLFWSYWFISVMIGFSVYEWIHSLEASVIASFISLYTFTALGWISTFSTITLTFLALSGVFIYMKYKA